MKLIEEHYRTNRDRLTRVVQSRGLPMFLAEEVVQDIYVQVMENAEVEVRDFNKWINQILNNAIKKSFKQERHRGMTYVPKEAIDLFEDISEAYKEVNDR